MYKTNSINGIISYNGIQFKGLKNMDAEYTKKAQSSRRKYLCGLRAFSVGFLSFIGLTFQGFPFAYYGMILC